MAGGFGGFGAVTPGYLQGGQQWQQLHQMETDTAAQAALGNAFKMLSAPGAIPGATPMPGQGMPPGGAPPLPGAPPQGAPMGPPVGGAPPGMNMAPMPGAQPLPRPPQPVPMQPASSGPMGAPPSGPAPTFQPPPAAGPGGPPQMGGAPQFNQPMSWQDIARLVAKANPGAAPGVIAAAVSKAMPLMTADSQMQWRLIQAQLQQQRIDQGSQRLEQGETRLEQQSQGLDERKRQFDTRETRLREGLDSLKDDRAKRQEATLNAARQKAVQFDQNMDVKRRAEALKEWDTQHRAYDRIMRAKINAGANLSGVEKKEMLKNLDAEWATTQREIEEFKKQTAAGEQPGFEARSPKANVEDRFPKAEGVQPAAAGEKKAIPSGSLNEIKKRLQAQPDKLDAVIQQLQQDGWDVTPLQPRSDAGMTDFSSVQRRDPPGQGNPMNVEAGGGRPGAGGGSTGPKTKAPPQQSIEDALTDIRSERAKGGGRRQSIDDLSDAERDQLDADMEAAINDIRAKRGYKGIRGR